MVNTFNGQFEGTLQSSPPKSSCPQAEAPRSIAKFFTMFLLHHSDHSHFPDATSFSKISNPVKVTE